MSPTRILFVCMGNICRSPTAEAIMRARVREAGLEDEIVIDSAGTGDWHVGNGPDPRSVEAGARRGLQVGGRARQVRSGDFDDFDLVLACDAANARDLRRLARTEADRAKVRLLREFDPASAGASDLDVPDPYYGEGDGFDRVIDLVDSACTGLLAELRAPR